MRRAQERWSVHQALEQCTARLDPLLAVVVDEVEQLGTPIGSIMASLLRGCVCRTASMATGRRVAFGDG
jgi:hypothetical protein